MTVFATVSFERGYVGGTYREVSAIGMWNGESLIASRVLDNGALFSNGYNATVNVSEDGAYAVFRDVRSASFNMVQVLREDGAHWELPASSVGSADTWHAQATSFVAKDGWLYAADLSFRLRLDTWEREDLSFYPPIPLALPYGAGMSPSEGPAGIAYVVDSAYDPSINGVWVVISTGGVLDSEIRLYDIETRSQVQAQYIQAEWFNASIRPAMNGDHVAICGENTSIYSTRNEKLIAQTSGVRSCNVQFSHNRCIVWYGRNVSFSLEADVLGFARIIDLDDGRISELSIKLPYGVNRPDWMHAPRSGNSHFYGASIGGSALIGGDDSGCFFCDEDTGVMLDKRLWRTIDIATGKLGSVPEFVMAEHGVWHGAQYATLTAYGAQPQVTIYEPGTFFTNLRYAAEQIG